MASFTNPQLRINALESMLPLDLRAKILAKRVEIDNYKRQLLLDAARFRPINPHDPMFALDFKLYQQVVQSMHTQIANFEASVWAEDAELQSAHMLLKELSFLKEQQGEAGSHDGGSALTGEALERANASWLNDSTDDDVQSRVSATSGLSERCLLCGRPSAGRLGPSSFTQRLGTTGFRAARSALYSAPLPLRRSADVFIPSAHTPTYGSHACAPMQHANPPSGIKTFASRKRSLDVLAQSFREQLWKDTNQTAKCEATGAQKSQPDKSSLNTTSSTKTSALYTKSRIPSPPQTTSHALSLASSSLPPTPHALTPKSDGTLSVSAGIFGASGTCKVAEITKPMNKLHSVDVATLKTPSPSTYKLTAQNLLLSQRQVSSKALDEEILSHISMSTMVQLADSQSNLLPPPAFLYNSGVFGRVDSTTDMQSCCSGPWDVHEFGVCRCPSVYSHSQASVYSHSQVCQAKGNRMDSVTEQQDDDVKEVAQPINVGLHLSLWKGIDEVAQDVEKASEGASSFTGSDRVSSRWSSRSSSAATSHVPTQAVIIKTRNKDSMDLATKTSFKKGVAKLFSKVFSR